MIHNSIYVTQHPQMDLLRLDSVVFINCEEEGLTF